VDRRGERTSDIAWKDVRRPGRGVEVDGRVGIERVLRRLSLRACGVYDVKKTAGYETGRKRVGKTGGKKRRDPKEMLQVERKGYLYRTEVGIDDSERALHTLVASVVVDAHVERGGVDTLEVTIEHVLEIIEVVMLGARRVIVGEGDGKTKVPPIIISHRSGNIPIILIKHGLKVPSANPNVDLGIIAV